MTVLVKKSTLPTVFLKGLCSGLYFFCCISTILLKTSNKFNFFLFADDTNLLYANKNLKTLENVVNEELIKVSDWPIANKLTLNIKKSNYIIFRSYQKKLTAKLQIKIFDNTLEKYITNNNNNSNLLALWKQMFTSV